AAACDRLERLALKPSRRYLSISPIEEPTCRAARGESPASHRGRRGAPLTRRDDREYRQYLREEQRTPVPRLRWEREVLLRSSQWGCIAGRMQLEFHHGLPESDR